MKKIIIFLLGLGFLLTGCQTLEQMQQESIAQTCTTDAAYAKGVNDGKANGQMRAAYHKELCPANVQSALSSAYRQGYQFGIAQFNQQTAAMNSGVNINMVNGGSYRHPHPITPNQPQQCIDTASGQICGYNCIKSNFGSARCAASPDQQCVSDNFGNMACGYNCMKSTNAVKCATHRNDNCVKNNFGDIKCGKNCRLDNFGNLQCDAE